MKQYVDQMIQYRLITPDRIDESIKQGCEGVVIPFVKCGKYFPDMIPAQGMNNRVVQNIATVIPVRYEAIPQCREI